MNFDEIKQAMDNEIDTIETPISLKQLSKSKSMLTRLKKWLINEIISLMLVIGIIVFVTFFIPMHEFAKSLLYYTSFMALTAFTGVLIFQVRTALKLKVKQLNSKKTIEEYLIILKSYYQFSLYLATGLTVTFYVPIHISSNGNKMMAEDLARKIIFFEGPAESIFWVFGLMLFFTGSIFVIGKLVYKQYYLKEIRKIEKLLDQF